MEIDGQIADINEEEQKKAHQLLGQRVPEGSLVPIVQLSQKFHWYAAKIQNLVNSTPVLQARQAKTNPGHATVMTAPAIHMLHCVSLWQT
jgi:hypothetical protein